MAKLITAPEMAEATNFSYLEMLGIIKAGTFKTMDRIGGTYVVDKPEFLAWTEEKGHAVDMSKLEE